MSTDPRAVFVFGSNLAGRHGKGAALRARQEFGAVYGVGQGPTGQAYAIPTKDHQLRTLQLAHIARSVHDFLAYARARPGDSFEVTPVGTGLAGYSHEDIAPMFAGAPDNCLLCQRWLHILDPTGGARARDL
jgi:hypothetical protein